MTRKVKGKGKQQQQKQPAKEDMDDILDQVLEFLHGVLASSDAAYLRDTIALLRNTSPSTMAATEFSIDQALQAFGITYPRARPNLGSVELPNLKWKIEEIPSTEGFVVSDCLRKSCTPFQPSTHI
jgi:hypothetical protein